jgi:ABC-type dipeptide/oligopeptide/nickel transport system permease subunit
MALPVALFEDARGTKALGRSRDLVTDLWWRTFGTLFLLIILIVVVRLMLVSGIVGGLVLNSDNGVLAGVLLALSTIVSSTLTLPLWAAASAYLYFDLRVRKEGFDLMLMASQISAPAPVRTEVEGLPPSDAPPTGGGFLPPQAPGG